MQTAVEVVKSNDILDKVIMLARKININVNNYVKDSKIEVDRLLIDLSENLSISKEAQTKIQQLLHK